MRFAEVARKVIHKTEVGLPRFSEIERARVLHEGKQFVAQVRQQVPGAGVDEAVFREWSPSPAAFKRSEKLGANPHAHHNQRHMATVVAEEMFLAPYVEVAYKDALPRPLLRNAVYAGAAGHDLQRGFDVWGAIPQALYKLHGRKMARDVREGKYFPSLTPEERDVAATSIQYHDVDPRNPRDRNPEDELLAIVDRGELVRLIHGVGIVATAAQLAPGKNRFEMQRTNYQSHYFPDLAEKIQPLSKAMLVLELEGMREGLSQEDSVVYAMQTLGMLKEKPVTPARANVA